MYVKDSLMRVWFDSDYRIYDKVTELFNSLEQINNTRPNLLWAIRIFESPTSHARAIEPCRGQCGCNTKMEHMDRRHTKLSRNTGVKQQLPLLDFVQEAGRRRPRQKKILRRLPRTARGRGRRNGYLHTHLKILFIRRKLFRFQSAPPPSAFQADKSNYVRALRICVVTVACAQCGARTGRRRLQHLYSRGCSELSMLALMFDVRKPGREDRPDTWALHVLGTLIPHRTVTTAAILGLRLVTPAKAQFPMQLICTSH
ncbi:hypothetical protein EVAR_45591_1 [Eumeta japonica]|uniref:Uncharacterized protein n=1 Tax=Eumeta variegata TaxID=151549 RepID=A0A4C1YZ72_EUMVA|nr:hypothetical protein EVAR_45591_1 [Eumeta japonica]